MNNKHAIRAQVLQRRDAIDAADRTMRSIRIAEKLEVIFAQSVRCPVIASYVPVKSEVDISFFNKRVLKHGWRLCLSALVKNSGQAKASMVFMSPPKGFDFNHPDAASSMFLTRPLAALKPDDPLFLQWSITQPQTINGVVVPLVAFDDENYRLGYGGGYYDRFIPTVADHSVVIGVAFKEQHVAELPNEPHDMQLPSIICL